MGRIVLILFVFAAGCETEAQPDTPDAGISVIRGGEYDLEWDCVHRCSVDLPTQYQDRATIDLDDPSITYSRASAAVDVVYSAKIVSGCLVVSFMAWTEYLHADSYALCSTADGFTGELIVENDVTETYSVWLVTGDRT